MSEEHVKEVIDKAIGIFEDFPKEGIVFRDIHPTLKSHEHRSLLLKFLVDRYKEQQINAIVGLESRGYYFGVLLAHELGLPFVPIRKAKKLPGVVIGLSYGLEYGSDTIEIQQGSIQEGWKVVVIDDLMATGGTMNAACQLLLKVNANIHECHCIVELVDLKGKEKLPEGVAFHSLLQY